MLYSLLSWEEIEKARKKSPVVILPTGSIEAHGKHLPLEVDALIAQELAREVGERTGALVLPVLPYGHCFSLREYPGTISISPETYSRFVYELCSELIRNGFSKILVLNGHGGNASPIKHALEKLSFEEEFQGCIVDWWAVGELEAVTGGVGHADESEASIYLHYSPTELVKKAKPEQHKTYFGTLVPQPEGVFGPSGFRGKLEQISKEKGKKMAEAVVEKLVKLVESGLILEENKNG